MPTESFSSEKELQLVECIGEGSYGSVQRATANGKTYAVKIINLLDRDTDLSDVHNEIKILEGCDSDHIVGYHGSFRVGDELWIVMEFAEYGSLSDAMTILNGKYQISEQQISVITRSVLTGLVYLHAKKILHRDMKCGNILLTASGKVCLADFGVSSKLQHTISKRQTVIGTPYWMAPEVIQEYSYDFKADIWSLGITIIEMCTGEPPLAGIHPMRAIFQIPSRPPPRLEGDQWDPMLKDFVCQCCQMDPTHRPPAEVLLQHPFIKKYSAYSVSDALLPMLEILKEELKLSGNSREKLLGLKPRSSGTSSSGGSDAGRSDDAGNASNDLDDANVSYDTVKYNNIEADLASFDDSTIRVHRSDDDDDDDDDGAGFANYDTMKFSDTVKKGDVEAAKDDVSEQPLFMKALKTSNQFAQSKGSGTMIRMRGGAEGAVADDNDGNDSENDGNDSEADDDNYDEGFEENSQGFASEEYIQSEDDDDESGSGYDTVKRADPIAEPAVVDTTLVQELQGWYSQLTLSALRSQLVNLTTTFESEVGKLQRRYDRKREAIERAIAAKEEDGDDEESSNAA